MRKIIEYDVIFGVSAGDLIEEVDKAIDLGWEPTGGICSVGGHLLQATVKYAELEE